MKMTYEEANAAAKAAKAAKKAARAKADLVKL